ncbi:hypothetical protein [Staphylococcus phage PT94]
MITIGKAKEYSQRLINASYSLCPYDMVDMARQWDNIADDIRVIGIECYNKQYLDSLERETIKLLNKYE